MATKTFKIGLSNTDKQNMAQDVYERVIALTFAEYDSANTYNEGDFVVYDDTLYKCKEDNVTGTWDSSKWEQATLQDLLDDVEGAVASVNDKANVNGNYPTMTVGFADNLTPYDESAGDDQDEPFSFQATGTGNGSQPDFATGSGALMKEKQGNTVVVNQLVDNGNFASAIYWSTGYNCSSLSIANGVAEYVASGVYAQIASRANIKIVEGHKYLCSVEAKASRALSISCGNSYVGNSYKEVGTTAYTTCAAIREAISSYNNSAILVVASNAQADDVIYCKNVQCIDLTQWFNGDIPQDLLDHPEHWSWYQNYGSYIASNTGTLVNADGRYIKCIGMNQWDEEWEVGALNGTTGQPDASSNQIRSKNYCKCIPNKDYYCYTATAPNVFIWWYDANKNYIDRIRINGFVRTSPANACYFKLTISNNDNTYTAYTNDISINLYYADEPRCLTYEPYQVLTNNDTGTEVLRSVLDIRDGKEPSGIIHRRVGIVDMGSLDYTRVQIGSYYYFRSQTNLQGSINYKENTNKIECAIYNRINYGGQITDDNFPNMSISGSTVGGSGGYFYVRNDTYSTAGAFKTAMSGVYMLFELAEETTEQGTQYSENLVIDDFGSMDFGSDVPQGALIFYPVDYKAFIDTLYKYTDGTPSNVALKSDLLAKKDTTRLTQTLVLTGAESEDWSTSGSYASVKRFNLAGTFPRYFDAEHPRGIGTATSEGLTINWIQDSGFAAITDLSACFYGSTAATVPQLVLLIPNSENVSTVEELRTWLASHNITIEYEYSRYKLVATLLNGVVTYAWEKD